MTQKIEYYFKNLEAFPIAGFFDGLEYPWQILKRANEFLAELFTDPAASKNLGVMKGEPPAVYGGCFIDEGTVVYNGVTVIGPAYIGKNCELMPGAVIRPNTIIGDGCAVGHGSEVKHCVMLNGSKVASLAFAGDSVLGKSARFGSGVITANRKFNQSNVAVTLDGERVDLGSDYFGCILGDSSRLGANSVAQPGTHIGPYSWVYPLTGVRGFIPANRRVYEKKELELEETGTVELK